MKSQGSLTFLYCIHLQKHCGTAIEEDDMDYEINQKISLLEEIEMQAQVLIPILKAVREEIGKEHADHLVLDALRKWSREKYHFLGESLPGSPKEKYDTVWSKGAPRIQANDLEIETLKRDPEVHEFNVTHCRYAEFFHQLGEPDLGSVLLCETDFHLVEEVGSPDVELMRTQTLMEGACCCDFRFRTKSSSIPK
jgi:hypothetical protein